MAIGHPPQRKENGPENPSVTFKPKSSSLTLQGDFFYILFYLTFNFPNNTPHCFYHHLKIQTKFTILAFTTSHLCEENTSLCSTLEPLYCNIIATVVGGIRFINFVDSSIPYCTRIKRRRCRGWCLSAFDE